MTDWTRDTAEIDSLIARTCDDRDYHHAVAVAEQALADADGAEIDRLLDERARA